MPEGAGIARHLDRMAAERPGMAALKVPQGRSRDGTIDYLTLSFAELQSEAEAWRGHLLKSGVVPGDRVLLMVRPGLPLVAIAFALFGMGAVPVVIDPGMGLRNLLGCVTHSQPRVLVGIPAAQWASRIFRRSFRSIAMRISVPGSLTARITGSGTGILPVRPAPENLAAILFTSGSTGAPKGVCYEHGMFEAQIRLIREAYNIQPGEVDLSLLPIFALFCPALGMTAVIPEIDPRRPAAADPAKLVQAIRQERVTNSFGSPTLWGIIGRHCKKHGITLPTLRRVLCAGAPVPASLWQASREFLTAGTLHSPYGATEALPVSSISSQEISSLSPDSQEPPGAPVGKPLAGVEVRVIAIADGALSSLSEARTLLPGEIGEIIVRGPNVTREYDRLPEATRQAKIPDALEAGPSRLGTGLWHRMGDCGCVDEAGWLWFCGRKAERVITSHGTLYTEPVERVFLRHPRVNRCALISLGEPGRQTPALVVEGGPESPSEAFALAVELRKLARTTLATEGIKQFYFRKKFPVDVRHNAKIHRLALARWAATASSYEVDP